MKSRGCKRRHYNNTAGMLGCDDPLLMTYNFPMPSSPTLMYLAKIQEYTDFAEHP